MPPLRRSIEVALAQYIEMSPNATKQLDDPSMILTQPPRAKGCAALRQRWATNPTVGIPWLDSSAIGGLKVN